MTQTLTCDQMDERLDAWVDGELPVAEQELVRVHLASCASCRDDEAALRDVLRMAQDLPRERQPSRDLWPGIAPRLAVTRSALPTFRLAVAAALLVAASSALTYVVVRRPPATVVTAASPWPGVMRPPTNEAVAVSQGPDEATFVAATEELMRALEERRHTLAPQTQEVVDRNLAAIDAALGEIRAALRQDPANADLARRLGTVHRRKIEVLQRVVRLSS